MIAEKRAVVNKTPMTYHRSFDIIKRTLHRLSAPEEGNIVYVSEGANTMDTSRSTFPVSEPRMRMDASTHATIGVGHGHAIAAHCAYNLSNPEGISVSALRRKIVCLEGDSAFGFSMPEVETMKRDDIDALVVVINNGGIYHGDCDDADEWLAMQRGGGLRSTSLGYEVGYEEMAVMCGGKRFLVRTPEELGRATEDGFRAWVPVVVNVIIESRKGSKLEFAWQKSAQKAA